MISTCIKKDGYDIAVVGLDELLAKVVVVLGSTYTFYILPRKVIVYEENAVKGIVRCYSISIEKSLKLLDKMVKHYVDSPRGRCSELQEIYVGNSLNDVTRSIWRIIEVCSRFRRYDIKSVEPFGKVCIFYEDTGF
jgi:hypothetical protein